MMSDPTNRELVEANYTRLESENAALRAKVLELEQLVRTASDDWKTERAKVVLLDKILADVYAQRDGLEATLAAVKSRVKEGG